MSDKYHISGHCYKLVEHVQVHLITRCISICVTGRLVAALFTSVTGLITLGQGQCHWDDLIACRVDKCESFWVISMTTPSPRDTQCQAPYLYACGKCIPSESDNTSFYNNFLPNQSGLWCTLRSCKPRTGIKYNLPWAKGGLDRCNRLKCPLARLFGLLCFNMGHNGHGINLYGVIMTLMGNVHAGGQSSLGHLSPVHRTYIIM